MKNTQDPKYGINDKGELFNIASGGPIPEDEPIFILRAKDFYACFALCEYLRRLPGGISNGHIDAVQQRICDFRNYAQANPAKVKNPDSVFPFPEI